MVHGLGGAKKEELAQLRSTQATNEATAFILPSRTACTNKSRKLMSSCKMGTFFSSVMLPNHTLKFFNNERSLLYVRIFSDANKRLIAAILATRNARSNYLECKRPTRSMYKAWLLGSSAARLTTK